MADDFRRQPQEIVDKILFQHEIFAHDRFLLPSTGVIPHDTKMKSIELFGTEVAPAVKNALTQLLELARCRR